MAAILRSPSLLPPSRSLSARSRRAPTAPPLLSLGQTLSWRPQLKLTKTPSRHLQLWSYRTPLASSGETAGTEEVEVEEKASQEDSDDDITAEDSASDGGIIDTEELTASIVLASLQSYKEALANDDQSRIAEIETFLQSIEDEKNSLAVKVASLSEELAAERERTLRISADFDNFRKRTERERLSLMTNVQGEVVESLLPVLDNFERAKAQIKVETEGEEKINSSYQSIYKQFQEILNSLGVESVETVGHSFDPLLHEAIMREESTEFEEGIILQEFRKGFRLGERLLRPSMVKVSAGPGPVKPKVEDQQSEEIGQDSTEGGGVPA